MDRISLDPSSGKPVGRAPPDPDVEGEHGALVRVGGQFGFAQAESRRGDIKRLKVIAAETTGGGVGDRQVDAAGNRSVRGEADQAARTEPGIPQVALGIQG